MMFDMIPFVHKNHYAVDPFKELRDFERSFFDDTLTGGVFSTDIKEKDDAYELIAELPGFNKEDIRLDLDGNYLTITAQRKEEKEEKENGAYLRRERRYGSFSRSFNVSGVRTDAIEASYNNGILTLTLPKGEPKAKTIEIR